MIDRDREETMPLKTLQPRLPVRRTMQTLYNWCKIGVRHPDTGQLIRMESLMEGGERHSSVEAYLRFSAKLSDDGPN